MIVLLQIPDHNRSQCTQQLLPLWLKTWDNHANNNDTNLLLQVIRIQWNMLHLYKVQQLLSADGFLKCDKHFMSERNVS
jgi:hypothetical protein